MTVLRQPPAEFPYVDRRLPQNLRLHEQRFNDALAGTNSAAVAFSGGVDSSVTIALTARALGRNRVMAVLGVSPSLSGQERRQAGVTARSLGVRCREVRTHELDNPDYVANRGNRCYFCKFELYTQAFTQGVTELGCEVFLNGDTADDHKRDDRPGRLAAEQLGVRSPLAEAEIGKDAVRALARELGIAVWDKPSAPCLASRVPVNAPVTRERLAQIEQAEDGLLALGMRHLRVRHLGTTALVELGAEEHVRLEESGFRAEVLRAVTDTGFLRVELADQVLERS